MSGFEVILGLLLACVALALLAARLGLPVPVVLVLGGVVVALLPLRHLELDPDVAFAIFVPPLLFRGALTTSLRGLQRNLRAVSLLAVGLVTVTTAGVAWIVARTVPGLGWPASFVLGAILSPPDAVVAISLARSLKLPSRVVSLLEGETLLNDTTAFVLYRMAVAAAVTGTFSLGLAAVRFLLVGTGGALIGWVVYRGIRWTREMLHDPVLENVVWLLTPFAAFLPAEAVGASGVLAVVVAGVLLRQSSPLRVTARTRVQANAVYDLVEFILNGLVFVLIGLQVGAIVRDPAGPPLPAIVRSSAIVATAVMAIRLLWMYPAAWLPRLLSKRIRKAEAAPPWQGLLVLAWTGIRGGDSLVTALALPLLTASGAPFPGRGLIVATTFGVILATLLVQGLTLRPLIRLLRLPHDTDHEREEALARREMIAAADARLAALEAEGRHAEVIAHVRRHYAHASQTELDDHADALRRALAAQERDVSRELLLARRRAAVRLRNEQVIDDEVLRHIEAKLDLEELALQNPEE